MVKFVCKKCNYRFESESNFDCPYCGRDESVKKEKSAVELLNEIEGILNE